MHSPVSEAEDPVATPSQDEVPPAQSRTPRRGATALEYLVMLSFILVVVVWTIQHLGSMTKSLFKNSADQTPSMVQESSP